MNERELQLIRYALIEMQQKIMKDIINTENEENKKKRKEEYQEIGEIIFKLYDLF